MNDSAPACAVTHLDTMSTIVISGVDARTYLQGQLSFDITRLSPAYVELAAINSAQGRVQAVVWLVERSDAIVMILPAALLEDTIVRLRKFVLRAKVKVESGQGRLLVGSVDVTNAPREARGHSEHDGISVIHWPGINARGLALAPVNAVTKPDAALTAAWQMEDIRAGLPVVHPATREAFVAQMLNLDLLQGISFDKGCYTGQEIIARMHFRGQVKRRMLRYAFTGSPPVPGTRIVSEGNHAGDVVDSAAAPGGSELLAVINLAQSDSTLEIDGEAGNALQRLPLPYEVK
jgi:folate-binding protein YgfZ